MNEIMKLLNSGLTYYQVAEKLGIEPKEVIATYEQWRKERYEHTS